MALASAVFRERFDEHQGAERRVLVQVELSVPTARVVRLAGEQVKTPDGNIWQNALVEIGPMTARTDVLAGGLSPATFSFTVDHRRLSHQADPATSLDLLADYDWRDAKVTAYLWELSIPSFAHTKPYFVGRIESITAMPSGFSVSCKQSNSFKRPLPDKKITTLTHPNAPASSIGRYEPVLIGTRLARPLAGGYGKDVLGSWVTAPYDTNHLYNQRAGGGARVDGGIIVDGGGVTGEVVVLFAGHPIKRFYSREAGALVFIRGGDFLSIMEDNAGTTFQNVTDARMIVDAGNLGALGPVVPVDVDRALPFVAGATNVLDPLNTESYAEIGGALTGDLRKMYLILPSPASLGHYNAVEIVIGYSTAPGSSSIQVRPIAIGAGAASPGTPAVFAATGGHDRISTGKGDWGPGEPWDSRPNIWNFGGGSDAAHQVVHMRIEFSSDGGEPAANQARIYWVALSVVYTPSSNILVPERKAQRIIGVGGRNETYKRRLTPGQFWAPGHLPGLMRDQPAIPDNVEADFLHNWEGWGDEISGKYTGIPQSTITNPADVARFILKYYGQVPDTEIENGSGVFGSFLEARQACRTIDGYPIQIGRRLAEKGDVDEVLASLAEDTASLWFINKEGKHCWIRWEQDPDITYPRKLETDDILDGRFEVLQEADTAVRNGIEVNHSWDEHRGRFLEKALVGIGSSAAERAFRDQSLAVALNGNDWLDFSDGTVRAVQLDVGNRAPAAHAQHVRAKMKSVSTSQDIKVEYGFTVIAGYNDRFPILFSGTYYDLTLTAGTYTPARLAAHIKALLDAALPAGGWLVEYVWSTYKFRIFAQGTGFSIEWAHDATVQTNCCALMLGFKTWNGSVALPAGSWVNADIEVHAETYRVARNATGATLSILTWTGANRSKTAWSTLGYDPLTDKTGTSAYCAQARRGNRETVAAESAARHRERWLEPLRADWLNSARDAADLRDRTFDWRISRPIKVKFSTLRMHDIDIGMVFPSGTTLDLLEPYPARGTGGSRSWADRKWMVLEAQQLGSDSLHQEIVAVECKGAVAGASTAVSSAPYTFVAYTGRTGSTDQVYVQKLTGGGLALWTAGGVLLGANTSSTLNGMVAVIADGEGGVFVAWAERRGGTSSVLVQHVLASGLVAWTNTGVVIATGLSSPSITIDICLDGFGGIIVGFEKPIDVYIQRINSAGTPLWTSGGFQLSLITATVDDVKVVPDGFGGAYVVWHRIETALITYAQHMSAAGAEMWTAGGINLGADSYNASNNLSKPCLTSGGIIVGLSTGPSTLVLQKLADVDGAVSWTSANVLTGWVGSQHHPRIVSDGSDGAFVVAGDDGDDTQKVRRVGSDGTLLWASYVVLGGYGGTTGPPSDGQSLVFNPTEGCIYHVWWRGWTAAGSLHGQCVKLDGTVPAEWPSDGLSIFNGDVVNDNAQISADLGRGFIVSVLRGGNAASAQRIDEHGQPYWAAGVGVAVDDKTTVTYSTSAVGY